MIQAYPHTLPVNPIGIFDSGLGGLTSVMAIRDILSQESIIYFGDTARTPYGSKSVETIQKFSGQIVKFLLEQGVKTIVIACNTVSSSSLDYLQKNFPSVSFIDIIGPMVEALPKIVASDASLAIIGTEVTIASGVYQKKISSVLPETMIRAQACPLFVNMIEEGLVDDPVMDSLIHKYLDDLMANKPDYLILGCTHYPLIGHRIETLYPGVKLLNPASYQALALKSSLTREGLLAQPDQQASFSFYASDLSPIFQNMISRIMSDQNGRDSVDFTELKL